jgi:acetyl-CoA acetyltransferase family protein
MAEVVLVDMLRIPFSRSRPGDPPRDAYNPLRMDEKAAMLMSMLIEKHGVNPLDIGDVITGCALQMKEHYMMGGRIVNMLAGLPVEVPGQASERVCCSGMSALHQGAMEIMTDQADVVFANAMEHMTHVALDPRFNADLTLANPRLFTEDQFKKYDLMTGMSMGLTAEKLFTISNCTREDMDKWSMGSHLKAAKAIEAGFFDEEIVPVTVTDENGETKTYKYDLSVRADTTLEGLAGLKPAFQPEGGVITAGNSSPLNAGAVSVLMMSAAKAKSMGLKPRAKIIGMGVAGVEPNIMGAGPVPATEKALNRIGLKASEIDAWEVNEAFAVVALYAIEKFNLDPDKVNLKGGAVAIGHPLACSGPRLTGTLARILQETGGKYGVSTMCGGGGQGATTVIERI